MGTTCRDPSLQQPPERLSLDLSGAVVTGNLQIREWKLHDLTADYLQVQRSADFHRLYILGDTSLERSKLDTITFQDSVWPEEPESSKEHGKDLRLDGISYRHIAHTTGCGVRKDESLSGLASRADYSASMYENIETFHGLTGRPDLAKTIFLARKQRERAETLRCGELTMNPALSRRSLALLRERWFPCTRDWFLGVSVDHGRSPGNAFVYSGAVVAAGWVFFEIMYRNSAIKPLGSTNTQSPSPRTRRRRRRVTQPLGTTGPDSNMCKFKSSWYSLEIFVPGVNLGVANHWTPNEATRWGRIAMSWARCQKVLGWILIPIGLAAIAGLLE